MSARPSTAAPLPAPGAPLRSGGQRWIVCGLLFLATTINYMDRQVIGLLKPELTRQFGWSEIDYDNNYTLVSDTAPRNAVSSIVGLGGMVGGVGGMFVAQPAGHILELTGSYVPLFILASSTYVVALLVMHLLNPRLEPMHLEAAPRS